MGEKYDSIKNFEEQLSNKLKGAFLKERMIFERMSELFLEAIKPLSGYWKDDSQGQPMLMLLNSRMFNDFESAKCLLMWGLPEQAVMPMRDTIECMMLMRLTEHKPELAKRWITNLAEYSPGNVNTELKKLKIEAPEYTLYPMLSQRSHSNLLASITRVEEETLSNGNIYLKFHFGGYTNLKLIAQDFLLLLILEFLALTGPLARIYASFVEDYKKWWDSVMAFLPELEELGAEITVTDEKTVDPKTAKLIAKRIKIRQILSFRDEEE